MLSIYFKEFKKKKKSQVCKSILTVIYTTQA